MAGRLFGGEARHSFDNNHSEFFPRTRFVQQRFQSLGRGLGREGQKRAFYFFLGQIIQNIGCGQKKNVARRYFSGYDLGKKIGRWRRISAFFIKYLKYQSVAVLFRPDEKRVRIAGVSERNNIGSHIGDDDLQRLMRWIVRR